MVTEGQECGAESLLQSGTALLLECPVVYYEGIVFVHLPQEESRGVLGCVGA